MLKKTPEQIIMYHKRKMLVQQMKKPRKLKRSPKWLYPTAIERQYSRMLDNYVTEQDKVIDRTLDNNLPQIYKEYELEQPARLDTYIDSFQNLMNLLEIELNDHYNKSNVFAFTLNIGQKTNEWNNAQWQKTLRTVLGIQTGAYSSKVINDVETFSYDSTDLIKSLGTQRLEKLRQTVLNGFRNGTRHEVIREQIKKDYKTTHSRAKLIARDQVAKLNGKLMHTRQAEIGITRYIWRGTPDERIREKHKNMDGRICRWDNSAVYLNGKNRWVLRSGINGVLLHPGQDYQCRCWAEAIFDFTDVEGPQVTETGVFPKILAGAAIGAGAVGVAVAAKKLITTKRKPKVYKGYHPATRAKPKTKVKGIPKPKVKPQKQIPGPVVPYIALPAPTVLPGRITVPYVKPKLPKKLTPEIIHRELIKPYTGYPVIKEKYDMIKAIESTGINIFDKPYMADKVHYGLLHNLMERTGFYAKRFNLKPHTIDITGEERSTFFMSTRVWRQARTGELSYFDFKLGSRFVRNTLKEFENVVGHAIECGDFPRISIKNAVKAVIDHEYGHVIWREMPTNLQNKMVSLFNSMSTEEITKKLSSNAALNVDEFVADGWLSFMNNLHPNPTSKLIGNTIGQFLLTHRW